VATVLLAYVCSWCAPVQAETRGAQTERLEGLRADELERIAPELARGPVMLVEFADMARDQLPAINIAVPVQASAETVSRVLTAPAQYPRFMPMLDTVKVLDKHDTSVVYEWSFDLALLHMRGRNQMTVYPAPPNKPELGSRITIDSQDGDLGRGRYLFRVYPRGTGSLLVLSLRLDLREANYVARQVAKAARSVTRSANIALGFSMALHTRAEAERLDRRAHGQPDAAAQPANTTAKPAELRKPNVDLARLGPLLNRGDLLMFDAQAATLDQIAIAGFVVQPVEKVRSVMHDANAFGSSLIAGSHAHIVSQRADTTLFDWAIDLPLLGVSGQMRMRDQGASMQVDATQGALQGGRWTFDTAAIGQDATLVSGAARFDLAKSTWLLEKLVKADPFLGQGMTGAAELMLLRAVRARASKTEGQAQAP
jgi:hypothetical protein